jgi:Fur family transcriptional regulator, ferric uptake regulator
MHHFAPPRITDAVEAMFRRVIQVVARAVASTLVTDIDDIALHRLRKDGQRFTTGRQLILRTLREVGAPITIPGILRRQPSLAQSSVYRNLAVLEHAGLVSKISMGDEHAHYELGEEITNNHHHHLVCTQCGTVSDVTLSPGAERSLDKALREAAAGASFELHQHRLDLLGRCATCAAS